MRRFVLVRNEDVTGNSGVGIIGEGIEWRGGTAALHWVTDYESFVHWPGGVDAILAVHGHNGATVVRFLDNVPDLESPDSFIRDASSITLHTTTPDHPLDTYDREDR